jgi:AcrR family transcriptional regulator
MTERSEANRSSLRPRRRQADRREQARQRILDAAEALFAKHGFHGVTLKDVAAATSDDTALLHYYFVDKAGLFKDVLTRRADLVDQVRHASLERYERTEGEHMTVEGILRAYLAPTFELMQRGDPGLMNYASLIARMNATNDSQKLVPKLDPFERNVHRLVGLLRRVEPSCSNADAYWFYHLLSGAITLSLARTGRIDVLSDGLCDGNDFEAILDRMVRVFGRGFTGLSKAQAGVKPLTRTRRPRTRR